MTRGTLFYYESDEKVWSSTEFNGDMYHGNKENPEGMGDKVISLMTNLKSVDDFRKVLKEINKDYTYEEGNDCWPIGTKAIELEKDKVIKWIEEERPDLRGNKDFDPREWETLPQFVNVKTWQFWGTPNLSDYSYIYNNSGEDLVMETRDDDSEMVIPDGCVGVLNYGRKDCLCKDGLIINGMGNYEEDNKEYKPVLVKLRSLGTYTYGNNNLSIKIMPDDVWDVIKVNPKTLVISRGNVTFRISKPQEGKLWEFIYR